MAGTPKNPLSEPTLDDLRKIAHADTLPLLERGDPGVRAALEAQWRASNPPLGAPAPEPCDDPPAWVNTPEAIHLSLDGEGVAEPSAAPPDEDDGTPRDNPTQHPITPTVRKKIEDQEKWGTDWPSKDTGRPYLGQTQGEPLGRILERSLRQNEAGLRNVL